MSDRYYQQVASNQIFTIFEQVNIEEAFNVTYTFDQLRAKYDDGLHGWDGTKQLEVVNCAAFLSKVREELKTKRTVPFSTGEYDERVMNMNSHFKEKYGVMYSAGRQCFMKHKEAPKKEKKLVYKHFRWALYNFFEYRMKNEGDKFQPKVQIDSQFELEQLVWWFKTKKLITDETVLEVLRAFINTGYSNSNDLKAIPGYEQQFVDWWTSIKEAPKPKDDDDEVDVL